MSGLTQQVQAAGGRVVLATATGGERGETPDAWPVERVRELRRRELRDSLDVLGVTDHRFLGFADGGCADVPLSFGAEAVRAVIADVQPDTVVTFGPDGMTGHPDHRAVSA